MNIREAINSVADPQGWNDNTVLNLLIDYMDRFVSPEKLKKHLEQIVEDERDSQREFCANGCWERSLIHSRVRITREEDWIDDGHDRWTKNFTYDDGSNQDTRGRMVVTFQEGEGEYYDDEVFLDGEE